MCAEAFNPDDDDEVEEPRVVHPKTDEQRCRLQDACKDILLFKTLEQVKEMRSFNHTVTGNPNTLLQYNGPQRRMHFCFNRV